MRFQSGDHLFCCLMSSVINKCMALISLCVAGALELVWSCREGGSVTDFFWRCWSGRGEVAFEQMLSLSAGWGFHDLLLSSKSIKLLLTERSLASGGAYMGQKARPGPTLICFFLRWLYGNDFLFCSFWSHNNRSCHIHFFFSHCLYKQRWFSDDFNQSISEGEISKVIQSRSILAQLQILPQ